MYRKKIFKGKKFDEVLKTHTKSRVNTANNTAITYNIGYFRWMAINEQSLSIIFILSLLIQFLLKIGCATTCFLFSVFFLILLGERFLQLCVKILLYLHQRRQPNVFESNQIFIACEGQKVLWRGICQNSSTSVYLCCAITCVFAKA